MAAPLALLFAKARRDLSALNTRAATTRPRPLVAEFLSSFYELGLALEREPSLREAPELRAFLDEIQPALQGSVVDLLSYPSDLILQFQEPWLGDEWLRLCRLRSALHFFVTLVADTPFGAELADLELADLDEQLREWGRREGGLPAAAIDPAMPRSHFWWWC